MKRCRKRFIGVGLRVFKNRIVLETTLPDEKYDMKARELPGQEHVAACPVSLSSALGVVGDREDVTRSRHYVLARIPGGNHKLQKPGPEEWISGG